MIHSFFLESEPTLSTKIPKITYPAAAAHRTTTATKRMYPTTHYCNIFGCDQREGMGINSGIKFFTIPGVNSDQGRIRHI